MASKASFDTKEWELIKDAPEWIQAALTAAEGKAALLTSVKENKGFAQAVAKYQTQSQLIRDVIEDKGKPAKGLKGATLSDAEEALKRISEILERKAGRQEADEFREFLLSIGESVAESAGEGLLGMGQKVSKKESAALARIAAALKATEADKQAGIQAEAAKAREEAAAKAKQAAEDTRRRRDEAAAKAKQAAEETRRKREEAAAKAKIEAEQARREQEATAQARRVADQIRRQQAESEAKARESAKAKEGAPMPAAAASAAAYIAEHTVVSGDTLSGIALKYYGSAARDKWMRIFEENKETIGDNPNLIRPGQVFRIPKLS